MDVTTLVSSLAAAADLSRLVINERDRQKLAGLQIELSEKILTAQTQLSQLLGTVIDQQRLIPALEKRIRDLEHAAAEKERYELAKVGSVGPFFAYRQRETADDGDGAREVDHFLCQPCFDSGKKAVLTGNGSGYWGCPVCKHGASTEPLDNTVMSIGRDYDRGY